jgi:hypothetical protein
VFHRSSFTPTGDEGEGSLVCAGYVFYKDIFGKPHWLTYCLSLSDGAAWKACDSGNETGDYGSGPPPSITIPDPPPGWLE